MSEFNFSMSDPIPVLDRRELIPFFECGVVGKYYSPPVPFEYFAKTFNAAVHHQSAIYVKRNILESTFKPSKYLSRADFSRFALELLIFGNGFFEKQKDGLGRLLKIKALPTKYMRVGTKDNYFYVANYKEQEYKAKNIVHWLSADINQEIYGIPEYMAGIQPTLLNESATLYRRKYYINGSHAGVVFYMTDEVSDQSYVDDFRQSIKDSRGPGNFKNLFIHSPKGKKDGFQVIPVGEVATKDDFLNIKNTTRDDQIAMHRVPPQLMGVMPNSSGGFGDVSKAAAVFNANEILPLQNRLRDLNDLLGVDAVDFNEYIIPETPSAEAP